MRTHRLIAFIAFIFLIVSAAVSTVAVMTSSAQADRDTTTSRPPLKLVSKKLASASPGQPALTPAGMDYIELARFVAMLTYFQGLADQSAASSGAGHHWTPTAHYSSSGGGGGGGNWAAVRQCESGGNYSANTGNGYYGAYQFSASTWHSLGYSGLPSNAPPSVQDQAAQQLAARSGMGQWPVCGRRG